MQNAQGDVLQEISYVHLNESDENKMVEQALALSALGFRSALAPLLP